jgi:hypothetical protein
MPDLVLVPAGGCGAPPSTRRGGLADSEFAWDPLSLTEVDADLLARSNSQCLGSGSARRIGFVNEYPARTAASASRSPHADVAWHGPVAAGRWSDGPEQGWAIAASGPKSAHRAG